MKVGFLLIIFFGAFAWKANGQELDEKIPESFLFVDEVLLDSGGTFPIWGIPFRLGSYELVDKNDFRILAIADYLLKHPAYIIELSVHKDCRGSSYMSRLLTNKRAHSIKLRLVALGICSDRIVAVGYEESRPYVADSVKLSCAYILQFSKPQQEALHQKNRRVELKVLAKNFVLNE